MTNLPEVQEKARSLRDYMNADAVKGQLEVALPQWLSIDRFLRVVFGALLRNPRLMDCTKESLLQSVMVCAQLGLEPILGRAHLIPYNNSKQVAGGRWEKFLECQFQIGYQGLVDLCRRSGEIDDVRARVVYKNDLFDIDYGTNTLSHKPTIFGEPGEAVGAYTQWVLKTGFVGREFMTLDEIYKRRAQSQAWQYAQANPKNANAQKCPWVEWPDEMVKKTALKNHIKLLPMSIEAMEAVRVDSRSDIIGADRQLADGGYGSPAITLPETTTVDDPALFDKEYADIVKDKKGKANPAFAAFWEIAREGNTVDGKPPTDDQLKLLALNDERGPDAFRQAYLDFAKKHKPAKKKTGKGKGATKKGRQGANGAAKTGKKSKASPDNDQNGQDAEYDALQQADEWQEMTLIFETNPAIYRKYHGKDVRTFDDAKQFLDAVNIDPDYQSGIPGA